MAKPKRRGFGLGAQSERRKFGGPSSTLPMCPRRNFHNSSSGCWCLIVLQTACRRGRKRSARREARMLWPPSSPPSFARGQPFVSPPRPAVGIPFVAFARGRAGGQIRLGRSGQSGDVKTPVARDMGGSIERLPQHPPVSEGRPAILLPEFNESWNPNTTSSLSFPLVTGCEIESGKTF